MNEPIAFRILRGILAFWLISLVFAVLTFVSVALLVGYTHGDLSLRADMMFWGLAALLLGSYAASLFFGMRFAIKDWTRR
ncbi:hypothetical protein [uncultured Brevundimonas sp.]|uniref:hypothetical protein n=1 Tax=uncultured Brevundimonas sp. TaxID=213418 RepID=UPI00262E38A5|nr:hypothetical protein [uncultured Brevundimonas sp.]